MGLSCYLFVTVSMEQLHWPCYTMGVVDRVSKRTGPLPP